MAKTDTLGRPGAPRRLLIEYLGDGAKLNILRSAQGPLRSAASGINNYIRLCKLKAAAAFPSSKKEIRRLVATFDHGETFGLDINRVRKESLLIERDDAWITPDVRLGANGHRSADCEGFASHNYIAAPDAMRLVLDNGWKGNFRKIEYI